MLVFVISRILCILVYYNHKDIWVEKLKIQKDGRKIR